MQGVMQGKKVYIVIRSTERQDINLAVYSKLEDAKEDQNTLQCTAIEQGTEDFYFIQEWTIDEELGDE